MNCNYVLIGIYIYIYIHIYIYIYTIGIRQGNINIDVRSTQNYNICYIGSSLMKFFETFSSFAMANASFQFMMS